MVDCCSTYCARRPSSAAAARGDDRLGMVQRGTVVTLVEADQQLPGLDVLVVADRICGDEAADMRRDGVTLPPT